MSNYLNEQTFTVIWDILSFSPVLAYLISSIDFSCVSVCACVWICTHECRDPRRLQAAGPLALKFRVVISPRTWVQKEQYVPSFQLPIVFLICLVFETRSHIDLAGLAFSV